MARRGKYGAEKRQKELKKKKKREEKAEKRLAKKQGVVVEYDEYGNPVEVEVDDVEESDVEGDSEAAEAAGDDKVVTGGATD